MKTSLMIFACLVLLTAVGTVQADYPIDYTVEVKENCIKFEDAVFWDVELYDYVDAGLGEEGVIETGQFIVELDGPCDEASVVVKAGGGNNGKAYETVVVDDAPIQMGAFLVEISDMDDNLYEITVTSDDDNRTAALSYIELCFCEDVVNSAYFPYTYSPNNAPGVESESSNDDCQNAIEIDDVQDLSFDTTSATFDGPGLCMTSSNIWFCYEATCTADVTVSLFGSSFDTMLAVYDGCECYPTAVDLIECNDDAGSTYQSEITFAAVEGNQYLIEIGGYGSEVGEGILNISCSE